MSDLRITPPDALPGFHRRLALLLGAALALGAAAFLIQGATPRLMLFSAAITLAVMAMALAVFSATARLRHVRLDQRTRALFSDDPQPTLVTDRDGCVLWRNAAASSQFGAGDGVPVTAALGPVLADAGAIDAARCAALETGKAEGGPAESRVRITRLSPDRLVWRCSPATLDDGQQASGLRLRIDNAGHILWMSPRLLEAFDTPPTGVEQIFDRRPDASGRRHAIELPSGSRTGIVQLDQVRDGLAEIRFQPDHAESGDDGHYESLPVPLIELDRDGVVRRSNKQARGLLALGVDEAATFQSLVEGLGRQIGDWLGDGFEGRVRGRPEVVRASRAATDLFLQVTLQQSIDGDPDRIIAVLNDATELKTLEAQFVQSQKMQAIGQLAGGVAHDFNNLLTAISGHCDLLLLRHAPTDPDFADLEQINQNANRAASLVGQLLAFSRKQNLSPERLDLRDILADLTHLLNRLVGERVTLSFSHDPALQMVRADKRQLEQVIMNLVVNARDAMPEGGAVSIVTRMLHLDAPERHDRVEVPPGDYVIVEVTDEGIGIPQDKLQKIFEPFFTTKKTGEGTGLGLSTAYGIVKQTGGYIFARSVGGEGTTFSLYFPATARVAQPRPAPVPVRESLSAQRQGRVLLVEDEAPVRAFAARALRLRGYDVVEAENGEAALEIAADLSIEIDLFVTDVIMPGLDGPGWVRQALEMRPNTRVIFVSGYAEESFAENQAAIPQSRFLPKPFSLKDLTQAVDAELG